jgi:hypothetical protein
MVDVIELKASDEAERISRGELGSCRRIVYRCWWR